jgi:hypothetical protein
MRRVICAGFEAPSASSLPLAELRHFWSRFAALRLRIPLAACGRVVHRWGLLWVLQVVGSNPAAPTNLQRTRWGIAAGSVIVPPDIQRNIPETILLPRENRLKRCPAIVQSASAEVEFSRLP